MDRNRFFKPRPIADLPPEEESFEEEESESKKIVDFYREFSSVVRKNVTQDN
jgi:hypothetical protein